MKLAYILTAVAIAASPIPAFSAGLGETLNSSNTSRPMPRPSYLNDNDTTNDRPKLGDTYKASDGNTYELEVVVREGKRVVGWKVQKPESRPLARTSDRLPTGSQARREQLGKEMQRESDSITAPSDLKRQKAAAKKQRKADAKKARKEQRRDAKAKRRAKD